MKQKQLLFGILGCLVASISWGAMFPILDHALKYINPFYFSFFRYGAVACILALCLFLKEGKQAFLLEGKTKYLLLFSAMAFPVYNFLFLGQMLMGHNGVMVASIMESLLPIFSIIFIWIVKGIKPKKYMVLSIFIAFTGAFFVITKGNVHFLSDLKGNILSLCFMMIGVIGWMIYTMGGDYFSEWSALRYSTLTCIIGVIMTGLILVITTWIGLLTMPTIQNLSIIKYDLLFMITLPGLLALICWNYGIKVLTPINGVLFINLLPITTMLIMIVKGHQMELSDIIGMILVITALIQYNAYQRKEKVVAPHNKSGHRLKKSG
ncbi:TPA: DMT family transporter [Bacillus thuringiensis]|nr:DMT family transporter [Bacillus thuringiensis]